MVETAAWLQSPGVPDSGGGAGAEAPVLEMIARHCEPRQILETLCRQAGETSEERQVAFFLLEKECWELAATGDLTPKSQALLSGISPETLSLPLFISDSGWATGPAEPLGLYRSRHLYSGIGELLGLFLWLTPPPDYEASAHALIRCEKLDSICRLAVLAIEQRNLLDELTWQADHDAMTGLYTRPCFERLLGWRLQNAGTAAGTALLCINLDRFRLVNGVLGHSLGNRVLKCVGARFQACLPPGTVLARVGGDEFAVLTGADDGAFVATQLLDALTQPFSIDEHQLFIGASIGVGRAVPGISPEALQRDAYIALYHAKRSGKGRSMNFHPSMAVVPPERLEMEKCLRGALAADEMMLYYQPQIDLASGLVCGAEALLRWRPKGLGIISPAAFIPILEETGLIIDFGHWVLREACRQGMEWRLKAGVSLRLAVNVSAVQFLNRGFAASVAEILADTGFPAESLELELTESVFIGDFAQARDVFDQIRKIGSVVTIDDFGAGQSSLSYLHKLPFQRLKIDQAFIASLSEGEVGSPLVENIIRMAASLGMTSVAEGIDRLSQLEILRAMGCDEGQGYFFSMPIPAEEFLSKWQGRIAPGDFTASRRRPADGDRSRVRGPDRRQAV